MKINYTNCNIPLTRWQELKDEFQRETGATAECAFRIDGTIFSTARHYGGFSYNGSRYLVAYFPKGELLGVRCDFAEWIQHAKGAKR